MYQKEYYLKNKQKLLENQKKYRATQNKADILAKKRQWNTDNPIKYILNNVRSRASREGLEFNLNAEDIIIPDVCPYLKVPLTLVFGKGKQEYNMSLDRINPTLGYVKGNVQVISKKANTMKSNASQEELVTFAKSILDVFARA